MEFDPTDFVRGAGNANLKDWRSLWKNRKDRQTNGLLKEIAFRCATSAPDKRLVNVTLLEDDFQGGDMTRKVCSAPATQIGNRIYS